MAAKKPVKTRKLPVTKKASPLKKVSAPKKLAARKAHLAPRKPAMIHKKAPLKASRPAKPAAKKLVRQAKRKPVRQSAPRRAVPRKAATAPKLVRVLASPPPPPSPQDRMARLCAAYPLLLLSAPDLAAISQVSQQLHDGDNVYAQSLTGALRIAQMFALDRDVYRQVDFARAQPHLFNVVLGAALALALNKDMPRNHFEVLISPLAATERFAWLKEVLPA